jgi:hypothetical protein
MKNKCVAVKCEGCFTEWYAPTYKDPYDDNAEYRKYYDKVLINDIPVIGPSLGNSETEYISSYLGCLTDRLSVSVGLGTWDDASGLLADMITDSLTDGKPRVFKFDGMDDVKITPYKKEELPPVNEKSLDVYKDFKELRRERVAAI